MLDVGCGNGGTCVYLACRYGCHTEGLTLSPKQARLAKKKATRAGVEKSTHFVVSNAETHAFPSDSVDLIWNMESSEHFRDKSEYFRRVSRALRPRGRLMLTAWTGSMQKQRVKAVADAFLCPSLQTAADYERQIEDAGLIIRECHEITEQVVRTWEICFERVRKLRPIVRVLPHEVRSFIDGITTFSRPIAREI